MARAETERVPLGRNEIAELLGVEFDTVRQWQYRGLLPAPDFVVSGRPAWWRETIMEWAQRTGRLSDTGNGAA